MYILHGYELTSMKHNWLVAQCASVQIHMLYCTQPQVHQGCISVAIHAFKILRVSCAIFTDCTRIHGCCFVCRLSSCCLGKQILQCERRTSSKLCLTWTWSTPLLALSSCPCQGWSRLNRMSAKARKRNSFVCSWSCFSRVGPLQASATLLHWWHQVMCWCATTTMTFFTSLTES